MKKTITNTLLFFLLLLLFSCKQSPSTDPTLLDAGVSRSLAEFRKATYTDVRYELHFDLPESKIEPVEGNIRIQFNLTQEAPVIIDFRAKPEQINSIVLNGNAVPHTFENEHILIDAKYLKDEKVDLEIAFIADDQSLNRRDDYMYTLLVPDRARTLFPCFDQPDMKAHYKLSLSTHQDWQAVGNSPVESAVVNKHGRCLHTFTPTEPLSTYLFSFVAGEFQKEDFHRNERSISIYHRETDTAKAAQCPAIADEVFDALLWLEAYTDIPYPFAKYDLIILLGFQFGGMEHTGATLYNDRRMFLNPQPTLNERLSRSSLIAHETAHMWFGDYVTMAWFDDVWTKEVFANYFASLIVEPLYPEVNHRLNFIRDYFPSAYSEDRTVGTNPIKQELDNMANAGLVYGQIIYNKSPIVMDMLVNKIGADAFQRGIQEYLSAYAYDNATWEDLIEILDHLTDEDLKAWSNVWVNEKGMPELRLTVDNGEIKTDEKDPFGRGLHWPQNYNSLIVDNAFVIPNIDGKGYGFFRLTEAEYLWCFNRLKEDTRGDEVLKASLLLTLYENLLNKTIKPALYRDELLQHISGETNPLLFSLALSQLSNCQRLFRLDAEKVENGLWSIVVSNSNPAFRLQAFRAYRAAAETPEAIDRLYKIWHDTAAPGGCSLAETDYISLSYILAIHRPDLADEIIAKQQARITNPDRAAEYRFISPSVSPSKVVRDSVFQSLLHAENRRIEPWASAALANLNHPVYEQVAIAYIRPALDILTEVQRTGDIFFPTNWLRALLSNHHSVEAREQVDRFFAANPDYSPMLKNKILQQSDHLYK